eukprot:CAMPEP_0116889834 /NCGR_PEP_ID=MMETSP0467-20121206/395_1 /TAXON_ID=283647 /ORGANISM="Mesodinium pulex, Strain SPMC105" /LENGTH=84 /DNA_ID=CAMNT_0004557035 /DNA_START=865 /DNA_END=1119 /DNA_ORIENTATION=+
MTLLLGFNGINDKDAAVVSLAYMIAGTIGGFVFGMVPQRLIKYVMLCGMVGFMVLNWVLALLTNMRADHSFTNTDVGLINLNPM